MAERSHAPSRAGMPRWAKVTALVVAALALLVVVMLLLPGGDHGPSRHAPGSGASTGGAGGHTPPVGGHP